MKLKVTYLCFFLFTSLFLAAQSSRFGIFKCGNQVFKNHLYLFGVRNNGKGSEICIYKCDLQLKLVDSVVKKKQKAGLDDFLQLYSDTLHDYLNIYVQEKDKKKVSILRFDKNMNVVAEIENVEVGRLNSLDVLGPEKYYFRNTAYSVKMVADTSGKQFYLNKHVLKSENDNFNYETSWQFPFERRNIHEVHIFKADDKQVLLHVSVNGGLKTGNWILRIDAQSGKLIKGTRLNSKAEQAHYFYGNYWSDKNNKLLHLWGQKIPESRLSFTNRTINLFNLPSVTLYHLVIDSLGEVIQRDEFNIPVNQLKSGTKSVNTAFGIKVKKVWQTTSGKTILECDIYKSTGDALCFYYCNSQLITFSMGEEKLLIEKTVLSPNMDIEQYYFNNDKLNISGKICVDSSDKFQQLILKEPVIPVKYFFKTDELNNSCWLLSKNNVLKKTINFSSLMPNKKIYQLKTVAEIEKSYEPLYTAPTASSFIILSQHPSSGLECTLYKW